MWSPGSAHTHPSVQTSGLPRLQGRMEERSGAGPPSPPGKKGLGHALTRKPGGGEKGQPGLARGPVGWATWGIKSLPAWMGNEEFWDSSCELEELMNPRNAVPVNSKLLWRLHCFPEPWNPRVSRRCWA